MAASNLDTISHIQQEGARSFESLTDLSILLQSRGLPFSGCGYYWQVGTITKTQGWILHLSVIKNRLIELIELIIPELKKRNVSFKIPRDTVTAGNLIDGRLGLIHLGKLICIYPDSEQVARHLAVYLIKLTSHLQGPAILTDYFLGSTLYTRYGSFNPVINKSSDGTPVKYIQDHRGVLIPDPYDIPFKLPKNVAWPFDEITPYHSNHKSILLNKRYYPLYTIKHDPKGNVMKAIYFDKPWKVRSCIIKQAIPFMQADHGGRDITDKLRWQLQIFKDIHEHIPMPRVFDNFEEAGVLHIVMDYLDGISISKWITLLYANQSWVDLSRAKQLKLLDVLLEILNIIRRLHKLSYIHRDITPENFIIDKEGKIFLIDLELTWSAQFFHLNPPFGLGTPGFMSPEQLYGLTPTIKEDVYALGAFMLAVFTNISATKWNNVNLPHLRKMLPIFLEREDINTLICSCLEYDPGKRPEIDDLVSTLTLYRQTLNSNPIERLKSHEQKPNGYAFPKSIIQLSLDGLTSASLASFNGLWVSRIEREHSKMRTDQLEFVVKPGWHTGVAGPLWAIAQAKKAGLNVSMCQSTFENNWQYLRKTILQQPTTLVPGLFHGVGGIALTIVESIENNLIEKDEHIQTFLETCFANRPKDLGLGDGIAGQGIALLRCKDFLIKDEAHYLLNNYVNNILISQKKDGSWPPNTVNSESNPYEEHSGVILFLLAYFELYPSPSVSIALDKAIHWLISATFTNSGKLKSTSQVTLSTQTSVLLCLIYTYYIRKDENAKALAENIIRQTPARLTFSDFTLQHGLSAYGHVLIDAAQIFKNQEWWERARWIENVFQLTFQESTNTLGYWITEQNPAVTADLYQGISGIIHFLIRFSSPDTIEHPLWPNQRSIT
jgi:serine/threonine protein kinase